MVSIPTTDPEAIRAAIATKIRALNTSIAYAYEDTIFEYVPELDDDEKIAGANPRHFNIICEPETVDPDGIHGADGIGMMFTCRVRMSYRGVRRAVAYRMAGSDARQIWLTVKAAPDNVVSGQLPMRAEDEYDIEERQKDEVVYLVDIVFPIRFKGPDT